MKNALVNHREKAIKTENKRENPRFLNFLQSSHL